MRGRTRTEQDNDGLCDKGTCRFFTCVVLTFIVIISEIVLISQGWTWGPWFFFNILIVFTRLCPCSSSSSVSESTPSQAEMVDVTSDRAEAGRRGACVSSELTGATAYESSGCKADIEAPLAEATMVVEAEATAQVGGCGASLDVVEEPPSLMAHISVGPTGELSENDTLVARPSLNRSPLDQQQGGQHIPRATLSLLGNNRINAPKKKNYALLESAPSFRFRNVVERARTETTEVDSIKCVIISDKLDGRYDIQYERDGRLVDAIMNLQFKRGFCGWHIRGTRNGLDDGPFCIQQGFLAKSGKLYWEEREESEAAYSVLVVGRFVWVDVSHGSFHGDWLSSKKMETGRFTKLIRRDDEEDGKFAAMSSAIV